MTPLLQVGTRTIHMAFVIRVLAKRAQARACAARRGFHIAARARVAWEGG